MTLDALSANSIDGTFDLDDDDDDVMTAVDTTDALATLHAQLVDLLQGSTHVAFTLASPSARRAFAGDGHDADAFDRALRQPPYASLLSVGGNYKVLEHSMSNGRFVAQVLASPERPNYDIARTYEFTMSLMPERVVDESPALEPYPLCCGHPPQWRTDSVVPARSEVSERERQLLSKLTWQGEGLFDDNHPSTSATPSANVPAQEVAAATDSFTTTAVGSTVASAAVGVAALYFGVRVATSAVERLVTTATTMRAI